jgi:hypothetical protein
MSICVFHFQTSKQILVKLKTTKAFLGEYSYDSYGYMYHITPTLHKGKIYLL